MVQGRVLGEEDPERNDVVNINRAVVSIQGQVDFERSFDFPLTCTKTVFCNGIIQGLDVKSPVFDSFLK
jgi:hypothetical protein